jgi:hypothetical protein
MNTFTASELKIYYGKVADGGEAEYKVHIKGVWITAAGGPNLHSLTKEWRIKPAKKVIDLSVLIDSQIDCEFQSSSSMSWAIGKLRYHVSCSKKPMYHMLWDSQGFTKCQPRMNHKHAWQGGECPLPEGFVVEVWWRDGRSDVRPINSRNGLYWKHDNHASDIIHFKVLRVADGYVMPWEAP